MRLQVQGRVLTGVDRFDHGPGAATVWQDAAGGPILIVNSGAQGGMSTWRIAPSGQVSLLAMTEYTTVGTRAARDRVELVAFRGEVLAFYGLGTTTFWGQAIGADGDFGATRLVGFDRAEAEILDSNADFLRLWAGMRDDAPPGLPDLPAWAGATDLVQVGADLVFTGGTETGLRVLVPDAQPDLVGTGMGIAAPTGVVVFGSGDAARVVVAGAGGSSLSVLRAGPDGYTPTEHVIDTGQTAFAQVQALAGVRVPTPAGTLDLVLAGGGDHGVTLFALTPQGRLVWLDTLFDTAQTGLHNLATLNATLVGDKVIITATSQRDAGVTVLTLPLDSFGGIAPGGRGTAKDDILIARDGVTTLTGGAGADIFVIHPQAQTVTITDFTPGLDRLDLSGWPMLRSPGQISMETLPDGSLLQYHGVRLQVIASTSKPLTQADLFPRGLEGADHVRVLTPEAFIPPASDPPVMPMGIVRTGTNGPDLIHGSDGPDTLHALDGADTLIGGDGDDFLFGGDSEADLRDVIYAGDGDDRLDGGHGNDGLHGGNGTDTVLGGFGNDTLIGNAGDDVIAGGPGSDAVFGGPGNDTINGGFGFDRINGGDGGDRFFHTGAKQHASDWIQDYDAAEGDVLVFGDLSATRDDFHVTMANTPRAGADDVAEAFVIYRPTDPVERQIMWALVDGDGNDSINIQLNGQVFDLLA